MASLRRIICSRFKKDRQDKWVKERRRTCSLCMYNSLNQQRTTPWIKVLKALSDFYTWITMAEKEDLGTCTDCGCDIYFKTLDAEDKKDCRKGFWEN